MFLSMVNTPQKVPIELKVKIPTKGLPSPTAVNWFHFTRMDNEVQMLAGFIDAYEVVQHQLHASQNDIDPEVSHRFMLSLNGFLFLRQQVEQIFNSLRTTGAIEEPRSGTTNG